MNGNHTETYISSLLARLNALTRERDEAVTKWAAFMEWLTDQQIVHWTLIEETKDDPIAAVKALLQTYLNEINDPAISEVARKASERDEAVRVAAELRALAEKMAPHIIAFRTATDVIHAGGIGRHSIAKADQCSICYLRAEVDATLDALAHGGSKPQEG